MTTQTAVISGATRLPGTLTAVLTAVGGNIILASGTAVELTVARGQYVCTFSSLVAAGVYTLILLHNGETAASGQRVFVGVDGEQAASGASAGSATVENQVLMLQSLAVIQGAGFTGPHTLTLTITDGAVALSGARVSLTRAALSQTVTANGSGVAVFFVEPGTYAYVAACPGFAGAAGTVVVSADKSETIPLTPLVLTPSTDPGLTTGFLVALDQVGQIEVGVEFSCQLVREPVGSGFGFDNEIRTAVSAAVTGVVEFPGLIKGGTYYIWRGTKKNKTERVVPVSAGGTWAIVNILGKETTA